MSGILIGQAILWLIVAIVVIAIAVYLVNWLYHRSSKEVSFVRTGFMGERVVINGGAFVLPFIHDFTPVNMNVLPMAITRSKQGALITRDRMRIDIEADFYVRVQPTREAVSIAASTLGQRTLAPEQLHALLSGKFISALRSVASEMTMEQMHEQRGEYVARVKAAAAEALAQNGLELESVAITDLDQTDLEYFNPSNRFDAEGLTRLIEEIEAKHKLRNDIEQDSAMKIRTRNLEAERQALGIERSSETARLDQEPDIEMRSALQRTEVARERALRDTEAENVLTDEARTSLFRRKLLDRIEGIVRESVKPMEKIEGIRILSLDGLNGLGGGGGGGGRSATDEVIDSALRYRVQAPLIDSLLADIGVEGGSVSKMGGLIREARDMQGIAKETARKDPTSEGGPKKG